MADIVIFVGMVLSLLIGVGMGWLHGYQCGTFDGKSSERRFWRHFQQSLTPLPPPPIYPFHHL